MSITDPIEHALESGQVTPAAALAFAMLPEANAADVQVLAEMVARLYRSLQAEPIHQFYDALTAELPAAITQQVFGLVQPDIDATLAWNQRLEEISGERLINDLVDRVKNNDMPAAETHAIALITSVEEPEHRTQRARQIGNALGGLVHERDRAQSLIRSINKSPHKFGLDPISATDAQEEFARANAAAARRERPVTGSARTQITDAIVELSRTLPARNALHEPTPEDLQGFDRAMRAIFRCCLLSPNHDKYNEATMLMVEFSPKEVSAAGALAGVEQRLYATLGRTSRAVASSVFGELGRNFTAYSTYQQFARNNLLRKIGRYAVGALGLLANAQSVPFITDALHERRADARTEAIFALGSIGNPAAQNALIQALAQDLRGKLSEGETRRDAFAIISSLGRAARNTTELQPRGKLIAQVIKILPKDDLEFPVRAVLNFFAGKQDGMDPALLTWAAHVGTTALWSIDRPELARAGRSQPLGFRQPLIDLLARLAPHVMPVINQVSMQHAKIYSGAYLALGELFSKNPDPSQLPVIRQLLLNTALHDDTRRSEYLKETVLDTATDTREELSKDRVIASLVYALDKIDNDEAHVLMAEIFEQIQTGRLPSAGTETAEILMRAHMRASKQAGKATMAPGFAEDNGAAPPAEIAPAQVTEQDLAYMADLEASYLMAAKRRAKKVTAMNALGQRKITPAIRVILPHLVDSDPMIASAALTALQDMGAGAIAPASLDHLHRDLVNALETAENQIKVKVAEVLAKLGPKRSPLKERLEKLAAKPDLTLAGKSIVAKLLGEYQTGQGVAPAAAITVDPEKLGAAAKFMPHAGAAAKGEAVITEMDKKRAYMQVRQEWIRGGKRGPEPQPPG
ncbi:MAG: HEAT repeat domain-containing protein [Candidatus Sumerlaeaceae bacterium]